MLESDLQLRQLISKRIKTSQSSVLNFAIT